MTNIVATITIEIQTTETIKEMTSGVRAEFTKAIGEAYGTLEAMGKFNKSNGARTIIRSVVTAELAEKENK